MAKIQRRSLREAVTSWPCCAPIRNVKSTKNLNLKPQTNKRKEADNLKGYNVPEGYMGYVDGVYMLFASETDYREYMENGNGNGR